MNAMNDTKQMVLNMDMSTYRYPGVMQYPMDKAAQQHAGLFVRDNASKSIHPFGPSKRTVRRRAKLAK
jgi:hypothetical protein